jgi:precorrin-6B methylase 2
MKAPIYHRWFDYDRRMLPNALLAELEEGVTDVDKARSLTGASIGYPGWGVIYYVTACALDPAKPATILETGTNWGCSTIVLASALRDAGIEGLVHTVEIDPANIAKARDHFARAGLADRIVLHEGDSRVVLPNLLRTLDEVSVAFLDGGHSFELVKAEFETVVPKLARRGVVLFDNTYEIAEGNEDGRVNAFLKWMPTVYGGNLINLPYCSWYTPGLAMWQREAF